MERYNLSQADYERALYLAGEWWVGLTWPTSALFPALRPMLYPIMADHPQHKAYSRTVQ